MPRARPVDPFGTLKRRRPEPLPAPDPNDDESPALAESPGDLESPGDESPALLEPGELEARIADATAALPPLSDGEHTGAAIAGERLEVDELGPGLESPPAPTPDEELAGWPGAVEAANLLQVDPAEVRRRARDGELAAAKDSTGAWRINPAGLPSP